MDHVTPYKIKKECCLLRNCLVDVRRIFLFMVGQVFLPLGKIWWWITQIHRRRRWHPTPVLLPGKSHGWRSLVGCSPCGLEESDTTERLHFHFSLSIIGEGNGNPLQCSCLENPRDGGAWWAAVYGVAQSWTRLKQLSSSSSSSSSQIHNGQCRERGGQSTEKVFWFSNFYCHAIKKNTFISHYMLVLLWNHRFFKYLIWFNSVKLLFLPILKLYH